MLLQGRRDSSPDQLDRICRLFGEKGFLEGPEWQALNEHIAENAKQPDSSVYADITSAPFEKSSSSQASSCGLNFTSITTGSGLSKLTFYKLWCRV